MAYGPPLRRESSSANSLGSLGSRILLAFLMLVYFYVLNELYVEFIYPIFGYTGFLLDENLARLPAALALIVFCTAFCTVRFKLPSDLFVNTMLLVVVVPTAVMYYSGALSTEMLIITAFLHAALAMLRHIKVPTPRFDFLTPASVLWATQIMTVIGIADLFLVVGLSEFDLDFVYVYERRAFVMAQLGRFDGYIMQLATIANLVAAVLAATGKRYAHLVLAMVMAVLMFGIVGSKSQIVMPFVAVAANYILLRRWGMAAIYGGVVAFAVYLTYYHIYTDDPILLVANTFRRSGYMPILINSFYIDHFSQAGFQFWSYSKLSLGLLQYRETLDTANLIGYSYFANSESHANTGLIGSGYMNAGYFGIGLYTVILGLMMAYADRLSMVKDTRALTTVMTVPLFFTVVLSGDLPSMVLSGGLGVVLLLLTVMRGNSKPRRIAPQMANRFVPIDGRMLRPTR
jgi:hypothetical protein